MNEPIIELYNPFEDKAINVYDNGQVKGIPENELRFSCVINRIPQYQAEIWNAAIEKAANITRHSGYYDQILKLKV